MKDGSSYIAPSYDIYHSAVDLRLIFVILKFNPVIDKNKIKEIIGHLPFYSSPKFSENSFTTELSLCFIVPRIYLNDFINYFIHIR